MTHDFISSDIAGLPREESGGRCDVYGLDHERLILHLDRVTARGATLPTAVPGAGRVVSQLAAFWFHLTHNAAPSHFLTEDDDAIRRRLAALGVTAATGDLTGRAHLVNRTQPLPIAVEMIGALCDETWEAYQATGAVDGHVLPAGLAEGDPLPEPLYRAYRPSEAGADAPAEARDPVEPGHARQVERLSRALFRAAADLARVNAGLLLAHARFEFGLFDGTVVLIGDPLTPETASFREPRAEGADGAGVDLARGPLETHLRRIHWQGGVHLPELPPKVVAATAESYRALFERLTGQEPI